MPPRRFSALVAASLIASQARAQTPVRPAKADQHLAGSEEIMVTATKRPESIHDVPVSIVSPCNGACRNAISEASRI